MERKVTAMYFSPTGTTEKVVRGLAKILAEGEPYTAASFTLPAERKNEACFVRDDLVVLGTPVYAGRVPNVLLPYLATLEGNGARAVAVAVYGNRNFDDALLELCDILESRGFRVAAAGAFVGEHSFSYTLGAGRPDEQDMQDVSRFARTVKEKLASGNDTPVSVPGNRPYRPYYRPVNPAGQHVDIRKVTPKTKDGCTRCMLCVRACPMGSIDPADPSKLTGICIKCGACVKKCPVKAKYYDDPDYLRHKEELEIQFAHRRSPEWFV